MADRTKRLQKSYAKQDEFFINDGLRALTKSYNGRRFIWWLFSEAGLFNNPFNTNALSTAFAAGKMDIGQAVLARLLEVDDEAYINMQRENALLQKQRREELKQGEEDEDELDD